MDCHFDTAREVRLVVAATTAAPLMIPKPKDSSTLAASGPTADARKAPSGIRMLPIAASPDSDVCRDDHGDANNEAANA